MRKKDLCPAAAPSPVEPVQEPETMCYVHSHIPFKDVAAFLAGEKVPSSDISIRCKKA
jgi:hypothetical protein